MINYKNTMDTPFNIIGYHLSPSSVSKYMPNTLGLSKTKENVIWENPRPNTLFIGNTIHYGIEMMKHNNNDLIDTIKQVIELRGYANGELSRSYKYKNDNDKIPARPKQDDCEIIEKISPLNSVNLGLNL